MVRSTTMSFARRQLLLIDVPDTRREKSRALTSRNTSGRVTATLTMRAPATSRSRSRAIVSVSGSSGTSFELAPSDIGAELLSLEVDLASERQAA